MPLNYSHYSLKTRIFRNDVVCEVYLITTFSIQYIPKGTSKEKIKRYLVGKAKGRRKKKKRKRKG
jgi:hypothetical protein